MFKAHSGLIWAAESANSLRAVIIIPQRIVATHQVLSLNRECLPSNSSNSSQFQVERRREEFKIRLNCPSGMRQYYLITVDLRQQPFR